jgi:hypothetical protein
MAVRRPAIAAGLAIALAAAIASCPAAAENAPQDTDQVPCRKTDVARNLDFWVGDWDVYAAKELAGRDVVERVLGGCGIIENWRDTGGREGKSLFAYDARRNLWTQTWVTDDSSVAGGLKFKVLRAHTPTSTTFQGEIEGSSGAVYYDRTILTSQPNRTVRQEIQVSRDGVNWRTVFDALYVPHGTSLH